MVTVKCQAYEGFRDRGPRGSYFSRHLEVEIRDGSDTLRHDIDLGRRPGAFATTMPSAQITNIADGNTWIDVAIIWGDGTSMRRRIDLVRGAVIDNPDDHGRALLDAIRASPDDDDLRLVYADWLHDHGEPERAELIHVQCGPRRHDPAARARARDLIEQHAARWLGLASLDRDRDIQRGFLCRIRFSTIDDMFVAIPSLHEQGPMPEISIAENDAKACVAPDMRVVAVHSVDVRTAAYRAVGELTCRVYDVESHSELIPAITETEEITQTGVGVFPVPVWSPDGTLALRYPDGRERIVALPKPATLGAQPDATRRALIETLRRSATDWTDATEALLQIPNGLHLREHGNGRFFASRPELAIESLCHLHVPRVRARDHDYGVALFDTASKLMFVLADLRRRIVVREMLFCLHNRPPEESWTRIGASIESALRAAASVTPGQIVVFDQMIRLVPWATS